MQPCFRNIEYYYHTPVRHACRKKILFLESSQIMNIQEDFRIWSKFAAFFFNMFQKILRQKNSEENKLKFLLRIRHLREKKFATKIPKIQRKKIVSSFFCQKIFNSMKKN